jgi:hypothetical protein
MALCKLTDKHNDNKPIYINPLEEVVAVQEIGEDTWIITTALNANGSSKIAYVTESAEEAVRLLDRMSMA